MSGWIKAHRCMLDNPIVCKDAEHLAVWMWLLMNATYEGKDAWFRKEKITLRAGQLITGRKKIAEQLKISESKVQRILSLFEREGEITQITTNQNRLISINNWNEYQRGEDDGDGKPEEKKERKQNKTVVIPTQPRQVYLAKSEQQTNRAKVEKTRHPDAKKIGLNRPVLEAVSRPQTEQITPTNHMLTERQINTSCTTSEQRVNTLQESKKEKNVIIKENIKRERGESAAHFIAPSLSEVKDFISKNGCKINADVFFRYYDSRGWYVGKEKMKNWQKQILLWQSRDNATPHRRVTDFTASPNSARGYEYYNQIQNNVNSIRRRQINTSCNTSEQRVNTLQESKKEKNVIIKENIKRERGESAAHFIAPSLSEVKDFISKNGCKINADVFFRYYDSRGWYVGKEKMKNWQKQILLWQSRDNATPHRRVTDFTASPNSARGYEYYNQIQNNVNSIWRR